MLHVILMDFTPTPKATKYATACHLIARKYSPVYCNISRSTFHDLENCQSLPLVSHESKLTFRLPLKQMVSLAIQSCPILTRKQEPVDNGSSEQKHCQEAHADAMTGKESRCIP